MTVPCCLSGRSAALVLAIVVLVSFDGVAALAMPQTKTFCRNNNTCCRKLSIVLPAYNEQDRISETIQTYWNYLERKLGDTVKDDEHTWSTCQILIVNDGSTDETQGVVSKLIDDNNRGKGQVLPIIQCISSSINKGKAVARGIAKVVAQDSNHGNGNSILLVADADGSGDISCLEQMLQDLGELVEGDFTRPGIVVGNRGYQGTSVSRAITRWGFRTTVQAICGYLRVSDTQCGFKVMTLCAADMLYRDLNLSRWTHDVEVLFRVKLLQVPVSEREVVWKDKEGSKLEQEPGGTVGISLVMLFEVLKMRWNYAMGKWSLPKTDRERGTVSVS